MLDELDSYALSDFLHFSQETYFRLFALHNEALWPLHLVALPCGGAVLHLLLRGHDRSAWGLLALLWAWVAWAFHFERYTTINLAAPYFAGLFGLEAVLLLVLGAMGGRLPALAPPHGHTAGTRYRRVTAGARRGGAAILSYAILLHPLTGFLAGRTWSELSYFGMAPDPTVIGTLGALLFSGGHLRWLLLFPAVTWCAVTVLTAYAMGSVEAVAPAAAVVAFLLLSIRLNAGHAGSEV